MPLNTFLRHLPLLGLLIFSLSCTKNDDSSSGDCGGGDAISTSIGYQGRLYDTHTHNDQTCVPGALSIRMQDFDVQNAIIFTRAVPESASSEINRIVNLYQGLTANFIPFIHFDPKSISDVNAQRFEMIRSVDTQNHIKGFGEIALYTSPWKDQNFLTSPWPGVFEWLNTSDKFIMLHFPWTDPSLDDIVPHLSSNPNARVLLHGNYDIPELTQIMNDHPNLYFTLDTSILLVIENGGGSVNIMFSGGGKTYFLNAYDSQYDSMMNEAVDKWKILVETFPDRVMWGTDVAFGWHTDPDVYSRLIRFSRDFISRLDSSVRDRFAYQNALGLFGHGL